MKAQLFRWLFVGALVSFFGGSFLFGPTNFGAIMTSSDGRYLFAGGTSPWALVIAAFIIALYLLLMFTSLDETVTALPGVMSRFLAFWLDFMLAMCAIAPLLGIFPDLSEWRRTGAFAWNFERTVPAHGDVSLTISLILVAFVAVAIYFLWPLLRRKPTPGTCIAGYLIVPDNGTTITFAKGIGRVFLGMYAAGLWIVAPFIARDRERGKFWLDRVFLTRAVRLK